MNQKSLPFTDVHTGTNFRKVFRLGNAKIKNRLARLINYCFEPGLIKVTTKKNQVLNLYPKTCIAGRL